MQKGGGADPSMDKKSFKEKQLALLCSREFTCVQFSLGSMCYLQNMMAVQCTVRESVEASIQQKTFAWVAAFVHKKTLYSATG
jgi:hypothetical protein